MIIYLFSGAIIGIAICRKWKTTLNKTLLVTVAGEMAIFVLVLVFGTLSVSSDELAFQILLAVCCSIQGLFTFAALCVFDQETWKIWTKVLPCFNASRKQQRPRDIELYSKEGTFRTQYASNQLPCDDIIRSTVVTNLSTADN